VLYQITAFLITACLYYAHNIDYMYLYAHTNDYKMTAIIRIYDTFKTYSS